MKLRIGIIFGGFSREREVSFAGGRTVYDNLNKSLFEPVPVFADSFGNLVLLDWNLIYKGSIRDFYPPVNFLPPSPNHFQVYAESATAGDGKVVAKMLAAIGTPITVSELKSKIDFAFLCLHGMGGEDGSIQGMLEYHKIPYSGSGILSSALGMDKAVQRQWMKTSGFNTPANLTIKREEGLKPESCLKLFNKVRSTIGIPCVIKPANQGSSVGASILFSGDYGSFEKAVYKSLFVKKISPDEWMALDQKGKVSYISNLSDIRQGIGFPLLMRTVSGSVNIYHPEDLLKKINTHFSKSNGEIILEAFEGEREVIAESFLSGKEFSCIVIEDEHGDPVALPPTEIRKGQELYDYRSKYMPGLSRKITPIELPEEQIEAIARECCKLFSDMHFNVYARIDGFITANGTVYLNDPNTTSGMLPSSFFFHQAAEIGLNPSRFLTYIIRNSIKQRILSYMYHPSCVSLLKSLDLLIEKEQHKSSGKKKIAVLLGGYSSERHISVESGRNIYEKLASSSDYEPIPIFLTGDEHEHRLYQIPINIMLKDNADDIKEKIENYKIHPYINKVQKQAAEIIRKYSAVGNLIQPHLISYPELARMADGVFIALHGRPGEDGTVQRELEKAGLPYNGSSPETSAVTINKYETNRLLEKNGILVPKDVIVTEQDAHDGIAKLFAKLSKSLGSPFIAKPIDDGCSSAVRKIHNADELAAYIKLIFRKKTEIDADASALLKVKPNEEFPRKKAFMAEELIKPMNADRFLEITGELLTHSGKGKERNGYEIFEASETLTEGDVLTVEEKFLAGEGQNITPARYSNNEKRRHQISDKVKSELKKVARLLNIEGYSRIDAFVRIYKNNRVEVIIIEVNSLPGMTPATCIFHQTAINGYTPYAFIDLILKYGFARAKRLNDEKKKKRIKVKPIT